MLYTINIATGNRTAIGYDLDHTMDALAVDHTTNKLYGFDKQHSSFRVYEINKTNGSATSVSISGISGSPPIEGASFDSDGTLWLTEKMYKIGRASCRERV